MEHQEVFELIDSYVLGALDENERTEVEAHLDSGCETCIARVREVGEVSVRLAEAMPQHSPDKGVKDRLMKRITESESSGLINSWKKSSIAWPVAGISIAAALALYFWGASLESENQTLRQEIQSTHSQIARLQQDNSVYDDATRLLGKPCTRLVDLTGVEPNADAHAKVFLHPDEDYGVAYVYQMPQTPVGKEYQLWMLLDGKPQSIGVFSVAEDGSAVLKMQSLPSTSTIDSFIVTIEPEGGLLVPSGMVYLTGLNIIQDIN